MILVTRRCAHDLTPSQASGLLEPVTYVGIEIRLRWSLLRKYPRQYAKKDIGATNPSEIRRKAVMYSLAGMIGMVCWRVDGHYNFQEPYVTAPIESADSTHTL